MTRITKILAISGIALCAGSHAAFAGEKKAAERACGEAAMTAKAKTETVAAAKTEAVAEGQTAAAATIAAAESSSADTSAPRDAASGLPTGKRQHKPVSTTACDDDAEAGKDMVLKGKKIQEN